MEVRKETRWLPTVGLKQLPLHAFRYVELLLVMPACLPACLPAWLSAWLDG